jgi:hypothetical protein
VHHAARAEEQQGLKECMREEVVHAAGYAGKGSRAEGQEHVSELADRRIGENAFQVELREGDQGGEQRRKAADRRHDELSRGRGGKQRRAAGHHIHARGDHRCRMDQRADGRRAFHRVGKPDVQRELGAFAAGAEQEQEANGRGNRAGGIVIRCKPRLA